MSDASLGVNIIGRDVSASSTLRKIGTEAKNTQSAFSRMGEIAGGILGANLFAGALNAVKDFAVGSITAASDLAESQSKVNVVFGKGAVEVQKWASTSATAFGMSSQAALEAAGTYGNLFQSFGLGQSEAQKMSTSLVQLASDLASFNNTSTDQALEALRSGLSGEAEPLKQFGIAINDARLKTEALNLGIYDGVGVLDTAQKSQAAYSLIMKDSALAQGDFARTSDGLANQQRILEGQVKNLQAALGQVFIPVVNAGVTALNAIIGATLSFRMNLDALKPVLAAVAVVAGIVTTGWIVQNSLLVTTAIGYYALTVQARLTAIAQGLLAAGVNTATAALAGLRLALTLALGPIGILVAVVGGLTYAFSQMGPTASTTAKRLAEVRNSAGETSKVLAQTLPPSAGRASNAMYAFQKSQQAVTGSAGATQSAIDAISARYTGLARAALQAAQAQQIAAHAAAVQSAETSRWVGLAESYGKKANAVGSFGGGNLEAWKKSLDAVTVAATGGGGGGGGGGAAAALETVAITWRKVSADVSAELDGLAVRIRGAAVITSGALTEEYSKRLESFKAIIGEQASIILQARKALDDYANSVTNTILGNVRFSTQDAAGNALSPDQIVQMVLGDITNQTNAVNAIGQIATKIPEALAQQMLTMDPKAAIELANYLAARPEQVEQLNTNYQALATLTETLLGIPMAQTFAKIGDTSAVQMIANAKAKIAEEAADFRRWVREHLGTTITVKVNYDTSGAPVGARAAGGPVTGGLPYLVGERGPELFVPGASGSIVPNGALSALPSAGGGTTIIVPVTVQGSVVSEQDLVTTIQDGLAQRLRRRGLDTSVLGV